jgi:hypothetical protein
LAVGLLVLVTGCPNKKRAVEHAEVTGKVLFRGQPLPGGEVTFVTTQGAFASSATVDEHGNYKISSPVGDVKISVNNRALGAGRGRGPGAPAKKQHPRPPGSGEPAEPKGRYVDIPSKYYDPGESGLTYTVVPGSQTFDIKLP